MGGSPTIGGIIAPKKRTAPLPAGWSDHWSTVPQHGSGHLHGPGPPAGTHWPFGFGTRIGQRGKERIMYWTSTSP